MPLLVVGHPIPERQIRPEDPLRRETTCRSSADPFANGLPRARGRRGRQRRTPAAIPTITRLPSPATRVSGPQRGGPSACRFPQTLRISERTAPPPWHPTFPCSACRKTPAACPCRLRREATPAQRLHAAL